MRFEEAHGAWPARRPRPDREEIGGHAAPSPRPGAGPPNRSACTDFHATGIADLLRADHHLPSETTRARTMVEVVMTTQRGRSGRRFAGRRAGVIRGVVLAVAALAIAAPFAGPEAEPDARLFAAHALALRAAGVAGDDAAKDFLAGLPGAGALAEEALPVLWQPFFENAIVKLGRLQLPAPVALYYNPLLDIAVFTLWELHENEYRVVSARALPGERLGDPDADVSPGPQWIEEENGPIVVLAETAAMRLDAFRQAHPAAAGEAGRDDVTFAAASADLRLVLPRLVWNAARRAQWLADAESWMRPTLALIEEALTTHDAAALTEAAPDTDAGTAEGLAHLPAGFADGLALDMTLPVGQQERLLIGSLPDDGDVYVIVLCRLDGDTCTLRRLMLVSLLG